jgi:hypothetical protein
MRGWVSYRRLWLECFSVAKEWVNVVCGMRTQISLSNSNYNQILGAWCLSFRLINTDVQMHKFYRPLSSNYKLHISFKSIENKTGEKHFNLNLSKNKLCTFIHQYVTIGYMGELQRIGSPTSILLYECWRCCPKWEFWFGNVSFRNPGFYIGPIGFFYNQVNDTGSWEPLVICITTRILTNCCLHNCMCFGTKMDLLIYILHNTIVILAIVNHFIHNQPTITCIINITGVHVY